jgi:phage tail sheath protein FI
MAELLSPGVFIEEVPSQVQVIQAVSTSNLGIVGFTDRGPTNVATLVTSYENYIRTFGPQISDSFLPLSIAAFFSNGGRRAYVVRVAPADATEADTCIDSEIETQEIETGDGATDTFTRTAATTPLVVNSGASPVVASSFSVSWRAAGTPVATAEDMKTRDGTTSVPLVDSVTDYEARIDPAGTIPTIDAVLDALVPGTVTISWDPLGSGAVTQLIPVSGSVTNGQGSVFSFDHRTGILSVKFAGTDVPDPACVGNVQALYTPATESATVSDDGAGVLPVGAGPYLAAAGSITYADGAYSFQTHASWVPHDEAKIVATYDICAWDLDPVSVGTWANDLRCTIEGDADYYTSSTATYSRFKVNVWLLNASTGNYDVMETYEALSFSDSTDPQYFPDVLNELSDYMTVNEPGADEAPRQLGGYARTSMVIGGGDESVGNQTFDETLPGNPVQARTLTISYTDDTGTARSITDDGSGNLIGDIDASGTNTISYTSGAVEFTTLYAIQGGTLVTATYRTQPAETTHSEDFAGGTNGTFDATNYGRSQFTAPGLAATFSGIYALDRVEELMQVAIPDFVGDVTITQDIIDYCDARATLPSGGDRFAIIQPPIGSNAQEAVDWFRYDLLRYSRFAAMYWPHVKVADPLADNRPLTMPVIGHVAGIYARTDAAKNVGKAPGGTVDGALRFLTGLELDPSQGERDLVYQNKINPLINSPQTGLAVWGVRTISNESEWRYINVRRLFMFLEKSVYNATHWIVFENNGAALWARIKAQLNGFMLSLFNDGYFAGSAPSEAFFVIVDDSNNDANTIAQGQVIIDIGVAANTPAEFVRFRFQQVTLAA